MAEIRLYTEEKLFSAMLTLIGDASDLPLRKRLVGAAMALLLLDERDFPDKKTAQQWRAIHGDLSLGSEPQAGEGTIEATCRDLIGEDAEQIAKRIVRLFVDVL